MKKKLKYFFVQCLLVITAFAIFGCSKSEEKRTSETDKETSKEESGTETKEEESTADKSSFEKDVEAFKNFYSNFYSEHRDTASDCPAKIIMNEENQLYMAVLDFVAADNSNLEGLLIDLYLFECDGEEVKEKAKVNSMNCELNEKINIYCAGGEIFAGNISPDMNRRESFNYKVEGNYFVKMADSKTGLGEDGFASRYMMAFKSMDFIYLENDTLAAGTGFEVLLTAMAKADIKDSIDLKFFYANYYLERGFDDFFNDNKAGALIWEDGIYYMLYEDKTAVVVGIDSGYETVVIPENVQGYQVKKVGRIWTDQYENRKIEPCYVESITSLIIPEGISEVYLDDIMYLWVTVTDVRNPEVEYLQIPDSVISAENFMLGHGEYSGITIFCSQDSYAQKFAEEKAIPYIIGTIENNKDDKPVMPLSYTIQNEVLPAYNEYIQNMDYETDRKEFLRYSLIHIDDDGIPELVIYGGYEAAGNVICNYHDGKVEHVNFMRTGFSYIPKSNLICNSGGHMGYYYDIVYSIIDGKLTVVANGEKREEGILNGEELEMVCYYSWNNEEVTEEIYRNSLNQIYDPEKIISGYDIKSYDYIYEAYANFQG